MNAAGDLNELHELLERFTEAHRTQNARLQNALDQIDALRELAALQQQLIDTCTTAVTGHQAIIEALTRPASAGNEVH